MTERMTNSPYSNPDDGATAERDLIDAARREVEAVELRERLASLLAAWDEATKGMLSDYPEVRMKGRTYLRCAMELRKALGEPT